VLVIVGESKWVSTWAELIVSYTMEHAGVTFERSFKSRVKETRPQGRPDGVRSLEDIPCLSGSDREWGHTVGFDMDRGFARCCRFTAALRANHSTTLSDHGCDRNRSTVESRRNPCRMSTVRIVSLITSRSQSRQF
jgi:hypothetical protein